MSGNLFLSGDFGLTPQGFVRMRFPEIRAAIIRDLLTRTGISFDARADTVTGQFIDTFAEREAIMWEVAEQVHLSMYPESATGVSLDYAVSFAGVRRLQERRTEVWATLVGTPDTAVPAGVIALMTTNDDRRMMLFTNATISLKNVSHLIATVAPGSTSASMTVSGVVWTGTGATPMLVAASLASQIAGSGSVESATSSGADLLLSTNEGVSVGVRLLTNMVLKELGSPGLFRSIDFESFVIPPMQLTRFLSLPPGVSSIFNPTASTPGRPRETDEELRLRYRTGVYRLGSTSAPPLAAALQEIEGVSLVRIFENTGDTVDSDGRPARSFEAVVIGGTASEIARAIYRTKANGIAAYGNTSYTFVDEYGITQEISFTRPVDVPIWFNVNLTGTTEEALPLDFVQRIRSAIVSSNSRYLPGDNVFLDRIKSTFANTPGISRTEIEAATGTISAAGTFSPNDIALNSRQRAAFETTRIVVTGP